MATPTPSEIVNDPELFAGGFLKILDKQKELVPLRWNRAQRHFHEHRTGRDIVLKARQLGFSTYIQGEIFRRLVTGTRATITLSHDDKTTQYLRRVADRFHEHCRFGDIQPQRKYSNSSLATYPEFDSEAIIATAGSKEVGRGGSYTDFHGSEVAFWPDAEKLIVGAMQGGNPDAILESTPNGAQGYFYDLCMEALNGDGVWKLHFYPWWWDDEYRLALDDGEVLEYTAEERELITRNKLEPEQIKWRRLKQKELKSKFKQEYPEDPLTCFLTSGDAYFGDLTEVFTAPSEPEYNYDHVYSAGLDFGQTNDYTALVVKDRTANTQVDLLHIRKLAWAEQRRRIVQTCAKWSHVICKNGHKSRYIHETCPVCDDEIVSIQRPKLGAEMNSIGSPNAEALRADGLDVIGFTTTNASKADIMSDLYESIHTGGFRLLDIPVQKQELRNFVSTQTSTGVWRLAAANDGHDDIVIALAISEWVGTRPSAEDLVDFA